jgi:hypothetical protein
MHIINNANDLLNAMRMCDFIITFQGDILEVSPIIWIDNELADLIKTHKPDLIKLLESEVSNG